MQKESLLALTQNMDLLTKHENDLTNATGSAKEKFDETYSDSLDAKINDVRNSVQNMYDAFLNSSTLKTALDLLARFIEKMGNVPSVVMYATTALLVFKGQAIMGGISSITKYITSLVSLMTTEGVVKTATNELEFAFGKLKTAFLTNPIGIVAVIFTTIITYASMAKSSVDKLNDTLEDFNNKEQKLKDLGETSSLVSQYEDLQDKINNNKLNTDELQQSKTELLSIQKQLADKFPDLVTGFNSEGDAICNNIDKIKDKIKETKDSEIDDLQNSIQSSLDVLKKPFNTKEHWYDLWNESNSPYVNKDVTALRLKYSLGNDTTNGNFNFDAEGLYKYYTELQKLQEAEGGLNDKQTKAFEKVKKALQDYDDNLQKLYNDTNGDKDKLEGLQYFDFDKGEYVDAFEKLSQAQKDNADSTDDATKKAEENAQALEEQAESAKKLKQEIDNLAEAFGYFTSDIDMIDKVIEEMQKYGGITSSTYESLLKDHPEVLKALMSEGDSIQNLTKLREKDVQKQKEALDKATQKVLNTNYDETGNPVSSNDDVQQVQNSEEQKRQIYAETENQRIQNNADTVNELGSNAQTDFNNADSTNGSKQQSDIDFNNNVRQNYSDTVNNLGEDYKTDAQNFETAEQQKRQALINTQKTAIETFLTGRGQKSEWEQLQALKESNKLDGIENADMHKQNNGYKEQLEQAGFVYNGAEWVLKTTVETKAKTDEAEKKLDDLGNKYKNTTPPIINPADASKLDSQTKETAKATQQATKEAQKDYSVKNVEDLTDAYHDLNNALDLTSSKLKLLQERYENLYGKAKANAMREQVDILKQQASLYSQMESKMNSELAKQRAELSAKGVQFDSSGMISNYNQLLTSLRNNANAINTVDEASQKAKQDSIENLKDIQKKMQDYNTTIVKNLQEQKEKWQEVQNQIEETYKTMQKMVSDGESKVTDVVKNEIDKRKDAELKAVDEVKKALQNQWDTDDYADQLQEAQDKVQEFEEKITNAIKMGDTNSLTSLKKEQQDAIKDLNDLQKQHERDSVNKELDDQTDAINKKYEEMEKSQNLTKMVTEALQTGFITINGEVIRLSTAMDSFVQDTTVGLSSINTATRELNENLADAIAMLNQMGGYSGVNKLVPNIDYQLLLNANGKITNDSVMYDNPSSKTYSIKQGDIIVKGNLDNVTLKDVQKAIDTSNQKFIKQINSGYVY